MVMVTAATMIATNLPFSAFLCCRAVIPATVLHSLLSTMLSGTMTTSDSSSTTVVLVVLILVLVVGDEKSY